MAESASTALGAPISRTVVLATMALIATNVTTLIALWRTKARSGAVNPSSSSRVSSAPVASFQMSDDAKRIGGIEAEGQENQSQNSDTTAIEPASDDEKEPEEVDVSDGGDANDEDGALLRAASVVASCSNRLGHPVFSCTHMSSPSHAGSLVSHATPVKRVVHCMEALQYMQKIEIASKEPASNASTSSATAASIDSALPDLANLTSWNGCSVVTSVPDVSETGMSLELWIPWFTRACREIMKRVPAENVAIFYQVYRLQRCTVLRSSTTVAAPSLFC